MKWLPASRMTQHSADGKYLIVRANSQHWLAYYRGVSGNTHIELGTRHDDEQARACCLEHQLREAAHVP